MIEIVGITLKMLIDKSIIQPGIKIYSISDRSISAEVNTKGDIILNIKGSEREFISPSGAARAVENRSLNGWFYWLILIDKDFVPLNTLRDRYRKEFM